MFRKVILIVCLLASCIVVKAQLYGGYINVNWNIYQPLSNKDFIDKASAAGASLGFTKFINDRWAIGLEAGSTTYKEYVPSKTYSIPNGNITTDIYNYHYYTHVVVKGQYFFLSEGKFLPYTGLGGGVVFNEYAQFYNVYSDTESKTGFVFRPEAGLIFRPKDYSSWGLKASLVSDVAFVKSPDFELDNPFTIGIQLGFILFND